MSAAMTDVSGMASEVPIDFTPTPGIGNHTTPAPAGGAPQNPAGFVVAGVGMIIMSFVFMSTGAPGGFSAFAFLAGLVCFALFFVTRGKMERDAEKRAEAAEEAEERFKDEIAEAVKERMKGTIKVRCRYCGSLNEEEAVKCGSCGATL